jgi:hypothetical protein
VNATYGMTAKTRSDGSKGLNAVFPPRERDEMPKSESEMKTQTGQSDIYAFRKRPVEIAAVQNRGEWKPIYAFLVHCAGGEPVIPFGTKPTITRNDDGSVNIETLEGNMRAEVGDWLLCGVKGEFYPCKPDIFEATYEAVAE